MLRWRLLLGTAMIAALVGLCWLDWHAEEPGIVLLPLAVALSLAAAGELLAMFRRRGHEPLAWAVYGGTLAAVLNAAAPLFRQPTPADTIIGRLGWLAIGLIAALVLAALGEMQRYDGSRPTTVNLSLAVFAVLYAGGLMGFLVQLRMIGAEDGRWGMIALVSLVATVKMSDIGQYTAGRLFGRHKLAPRISPGKTWEGVAGGFLFAAVAAWFVLHWCAPRMTGALASGSLVRTILYAVALASAGIVGDLLESLLKRDAGVKDSSSWVPGFGGVLDLLDSLLWAAPVAYLYWALRLVGP
jgi:phosphatidate cytidylyltransferase